MPDLETIHIIGIGGIGTSAIAQWLKAAGKTVEGSDAAASSITDALTHHGIPVTIGAGAACSPEVTKIIFSDAVGADHPVRRWAADHGLIQQSYAQVLGELTAPYRVIAISGSHGKSTTTAMTGLLLAALGLDPTVLVGTLVPAWRTGTFLGNWRPGKSDICVVEADEYNRHFHHLKPQHAVVTSLDHDHVDVFPTPANYQAAFVTFLQRTSGVAILEEKVAAVLTHKPRLTYAVVGQADLAATPPVMRRGQQFFNILYRGENWGEFSLAVPGTHMVSNLLAAIGIALQYEENTNTITAGLRRFLSNFQGTWRRFEKLADVNGAQIFSDYAHHPTELAALLRAAHQFYPQQRVVLIFQPHHHQRTAAFAAEFQRVLKTELTPTDQLYLCEVYGVIGRERGAVATSTKPWVKEISGTTRFVDNLADLAGIFRTGLSAGDIVLCVGAGTIDGAAREALKELRGTIGAG